jgi:RimJ/RimL family protein N-acetyltransferase
VALWLLFGFGSALAEAIESADADTIRRRFFGGHPQVTPELIDYLTTVDYTSRFALVAVEPASQRGVAIARYEPAEQDGTADVAIAVTPGWRDVGLATELLRLLARAASERGTHTFTGMYLAGNQAAPAPARVPSRQASVLPSCCGSAGGDLRGFIVRPVLRSSWGDRRSWC